MILLQLDHPVLRLLRICKMIYRIIKNCLEVANVLTTVASGRKLKMIEWSITFSLWLKVHDFLCDIKPENKKG